MTITNTSMQRALAAKLVVTGHLDTAAETILYAWTTAWDELVSAWREALDELIASAISQPSGWPSPQQIVRSAKASKALEYARNALNDLSVSTGAFIVDGLDDLVKQAWGWERLISWSQLPPNAHITWRHDPHSVEAIVRRTTERIESLLAVLPDEQVAVMRRALIRGVATGLNPREAADIMMRRTRDAFLGGRARAETIARTEMIDAWREGARQSRLANRDVLKGWRWTATLSSRTCPACLVMDGTIHDLDEKGPEGHQNCRCTAAPVTKSWAELGFTDIPEPEENYPTGRQWYNQQPQHVQKKIMGRKRWDDLNSGRLKWEDIPVVKHSSGWRDSIVTRPRGAQPSTNPGAAGGIR